MQPSTCKMYVAYELLGVGGGVMAANLVTPVSTSEQGFSSASYDSFRMSHWRTYIFKVKAKKYNIVMKDFLLQNGIKIQERFQS